MPDDVDLAFRTADADNNGSIDAHELMGALGRLGLPTGSYELALETMRRYDRDGDGSLQRAEFLVLAQEVRRYAQDAEASFNMYDADKNGRIDINELFAALSSLGLANTMEHAEKVMSKYSVERSPRGTLRLEDYRKVVEKARAFQKHTSAFRRFDKDGDGTIGRTELFHALAELGLMTSHEQVFQVFRRFDTKGHGALKLPAFVKLAEAVSAFKAHDLNGDGTIDVYELHDALQELRPVPSSFEQTVDAMRRYGHGHVHGDGVLDLSEYLQLIDEMKQAPPPGYAHVPFSTGASGGHCHPAATHPRPPPLPAPLPYAPPTPSAPSASTPLAPLPPAPLPPAPLATIRAVAPVRHVLQPVQPATASARPQHSLQILGTSVRATDDENRPPESSLAARKKVVQPAAPCMEATVADEAERAFRRADLDANGQIDVHELVGAMSELGIPPDNLALARETLRRFDRDGDGALALDEFQGLVKEVQRWRASMQWSMQ